MSKRDSILVAIPALNEEASVGGVVESVREAVPGATILVIDDGSDDATCAVARSTGAEVLSLPFNVGVGGAMRAAFLFALHGGYEVVVQVDADGQHDPDQIALLLDGLESASVVVGSRFAGRGDYRVRGPRAWAMRVLAVGVSRIADTQLSDTTSGFRASDKRAIALFAQHYPAEYLGDTVESLVIAIRAGLTVRQVPVEMQTRQAGQPSQSAFRAGLYLGRAVLALVVALARRPSKAVEA